jgi:hypothetical protein
VASIDKNQNRLVVDYQEYKSAKLWCKPKNKSQKRCYYLKKTKPLRTAIPQMIPI